MIHVDCIVLAVGHFQKTIYPEFKNIKDYYSNSWNWSKFKKINTQDISILGSGPSAIDAILILLENTSNQIKAFSKTGLISYPKPYYKKVKLNLINKEFLYLKAKEYDGLSINLLASFLILELESHSINLKLLVKTLKESQLPPLKSIPYGLKNKYDKEELFGVLIELEKLIPHIWHLLINDERESFKNLYRYLSKIFYGMAPPIAEKIIKAITSKKLFIYSDLDNVSWCKEKNCFKIQTGKDDIATYYTNTVIDCTGFGYNILECPWKFISQMIKNNLIVPNPKGGALIDFTTGQLLDKKENPIGEIYCTAGSLTLGEHFVTNGLIKVANSADIISRKIHSYLLNKE